jgi:hypothetical protein
MRQRKAVLYRTILVGFLNSLIGPILFILFDLHLRNLILSYLSTEFTMLLFKKFLYNRFVFREKSTLVAWKAAFSVFISGLILSAVLQNISIHQEMRRLLAILLGLAISSSIVLYFSYDINSTSSK